MRGLLSNEAGCGTAPTAHATSDAKSPAAQGVWGIFEVFVDTVLLCTVTALVILVSFSEVEMLGHDPVMMSIRAYSLVLGGWSEWFFCAAVFCFGYATVLCWANYGLEALAFLSRKPLCRIVYFVILAACIPVGAVTAPDGIWGISDFAIAALTALNLCVLFLMRREIRGETLSYFGK
jgi:AGCS family alanine or glycine:cation symporter